MHRFRVPVILTWALALARAVPSLAQTDQPRPRSEPSVTMTGEGVVHASPDVAYISVTAESRAGSPRDAQQKNAAAMTAVVEAVRRFVTRREDVQTVQASLEPEYDYQANRRTLRGYVARNGVRITTAELDKVGTIVDAAVAAGATDVGGIQFDLRDRGRADREALRLAVEDARRKAETAASAAGRQLGAIVDISEAAGERPIVRPMVAMEAARAGAPQTPVAPGELEIRAHIVLRALLQ